MMTVVITAVVILIATMMIMIINHDGNSKPENSNNGSVAMVITGLTVMISVKVLVIQSNSAEARLSKSNSNTINLESNDVVRLVHGKHATMGHLVYPNLETTYVSAWIEMRVPWTAARCITDNIWLSVSVRPNCHCSETRVNKDNSHAILQHKRLRVPKARHYLRRTGQTLEQDKTGQRSTFFYLALQMLPRACMRGKFSF